MTTGKPPATLSRRNALRVGGAGAAATLGTTLLAPRAFAQEVAPATEDAPDGLSAAILEAYKGLPGQQGLMLLAPPDSGRPAWSVSHNADERFFIASVFKTLVLAECLRQEEAELDPASETPLAIQLAMRLGQPLAVDDTVFSPGASVLNPPNLTGAISLRTALEAMIAHSDNTATDMVLKHVGPEKVDAFIAEIGLTQTAIPRSTRQFFGYVYGVENWQATTWEQTVDPDLSLSPRPVINDDITMASTPLEMASFYAWALQGAFFQYHETLDVFRQILAIADAVLRSMPLGVNGFGKGGSLDFEADHVLTFAGGLYVPDRWVYFALFLNWTDADGGTTGEVQDAYLTAARTIFTLIRDRFTR